MRKLTHHSISLGCDPEFFFTKNGTVIGSEKLLPRDGLEMPIGKVIIDGIQAELNPRPSSCRQGLGAEIGWCFSKIKEQLLKDGHGIDFTQSVEISQSEMDSLSESSKMFGCSPSRNAYVEGGQSKIKVDPKTYRKRAAGGHIHLGANPAHTLKEQEFINKALFNYDALVPILDLIVGNTCVLVDRSPSNIERRKVYGKAGEYRTPDYGIEYRTLSNFWLTSYPLFDLAFGLARLAVIILASDTPEFSYSKELLSKVRMRDVVKAINENDYDLALANFNAIKESLIEMLPDDAVHFPITPGNIKIFEHFISKPMSHWFKQNPLEHWTAEPIDGESFGFEKFLYQTVLVDMQQ